MTMGEGDTRSKLLFANNFNTKIQLLLNLCISGCEGTNSHGGGAILVSDSRTMAWKRKTCHRKTQCVITQLVFQTNEYLQQTPKSIQLNHCIYLLAAKLILGMFEISKLAFSFALSLY